MRKLLSLKHWSHVFRKVFRLLGSTRVPLREKLLFLVPVLLYWVLPDVLPFMPIDDIAVTMLAANWFADRIGKKYLEPQKKD
ncbi:hypothetical protein [Paenibacillus sp. J2TS4]|uniref:hypothetical protein n=1 Tax=Paenibacillus sp. J2TS4 TaxID=2807194 RepID=UPI001B13D949|nr:hypothetical protein [Paenibacillus sp. J2TS4]GIP33799.1 hypothetical protein J2TS4_30090 [Paenibacillus sp. J2TS4]